MATNLDTLRVRIEADATALKQGLDRAIRVSEDSGRRMERAFQPVAASFTKMGVAVAGLATVAGVSSLVNFGKRALESAGNLGELADSVGLTTKAFQEYVFAGTAVGIRQEELTQGFALFARKIGEARDGNDSAVKSFRNLGAEVEATVASGASVEQVFRSVANAVSRIEDPAKRTAIAMDLFGRGGRKFTNLMIEGSEGLDRFAKEAERLGAVLAADTIAKADKASDEIAKLDLQFKRLGENLATQTVPILERALNVINRIIAPRQGVQAGDKIARFREEIAALPEGSPLRAQLEENLDKALSQDSSNIRDALLAGNVGTGKSIGGDVLVSDTDRKREAAADRFIDQLRAIRDGLEMTEAQQLRLRLETEVDEQGVRKFTDSQIEQAVAVQEMIDAKKRLMDLNKAQLQQEQQLVEQEKRATEQIEEKRQQQWELIAAAERETRDTQTLIAAIKEGNLAYEEQAEFLRIINQLKATGVALDDEIIKRAREIAKKNVEVNRELDRQKAATRELEVFSERAFDRIGEGLTQMALKGKNAFEDLRNIGLAVVSELAQEFFKLSLLNPLKNAIFKSNNPTLGDVFGSFFGGGGGGSFGGFFAEGGRPRVGVPSIVGERGPEIFVPDTAGRIVPNNQLGGGGPIFNVDMRGASVEAVMRLERLVREVNGSIEPRAVRAITDARQRGLVTA
jgi:hypothetical protein